MRSATLVEFTGEAFMIVTANYKGEHFCQRHQEKYSQPSQGSNRTSTDVEVCQHKRNRKSLLLFSLYQINHI